MFDFDPKELRDLSSYADKALTGAKSLEAYAENARKMQEAGKTLSDIQSFAASLTFLSNVTAGLQILSMGLAVASALMPVKSDTDRILDAIGAVMDRLDTLERRVMVAIQGLETSIQLTGLSTATFHDEALLTTAESTLKRIASDRRQGKTPRKSLDTLARFDPNDFRVYLKELRHLAEGHSGNSSLFNLLYKQSYGNSDQIVSMAHYLVQRAQSCVILIGAIEIEQLSRQSKAADTEFGPKDVAEHMEYVATTTQEDLDAIAQASQKAIKCTIDRKEIRACVKRYLLERIDDLPLEYGPFQKVAKDTVKKLAARWPQLNFTCWIYPAIRGFDKHVVKSGSGDWDHRFSLKVKGGTINFVVFWAVRKTSGKPEILTLGRLQPVSRKPVTDPFAASRVLTLEETLDYETSVASPDPEQAANRAEKLVHFYSDINESMISKIRDETSHAHHTHGIATPLGGAHVLDWHLQYGSVDAKAKLNTHFRRLGAMDPSKFILWTGLFNGTTKLNLGIASMNPGCFVRAAAFRVSESSDVYKRYRKLEKGEELSLISKSKHYRTLAIWAE
ncbi:hypothetical protein [Roseovarius aestuariivivens]|uniref:hypothetical protein n=1 Tax=Roseovarius aestuariivivens TaxID=1888910 RepID=UPI001081C411|nr:hypothetical protein [Roseovarius aestuariivivens]